MDKTITEIYWGTSIHSLFQNKPLYLAVTTEGLCRITWPHESIDTLQEWVDKYMPHAVLIEDQERVASYAQQLQEYIEGRRKVFTLPLDLHGTEFQKSVWQALTLIPHGHTRSYSDIAKTLGNQKAVRAVGTANGANPVPIVVPCHRVIGKNAALTGFRGGLEVKEKLLQLEGFYGYRKQGHARFQF